MRFLHIADTVRAVTDDVAHAWAALTAQAELEAAQYSGHPVIYVRTDGGASGAIPIHCDLVIT